MRNNLALESARIRLARQKAKHAILDNPELVIRRAYEWFGDRLAVACSFGKCSTAVLHLALKVNPNIKVVFCNTGVEFPEIYAYRDLLLREWNLNLIETKPLKTFWACVREYGYPHIRRSKEGKHNYNNGKPRCCEFLKDYPMRDAQRQHGIEGVLTGLRIAESRVRMWRIIDSGEFYHIKKYGGSYRIHPIAFWSQEQLDEYHRINNIPENPLYRRVPRTGCMPCTAHLHWEQQILETKPRLYHLIQHDKGINLIDDYFLGEDMPKLSPCQN